MNYNTQMLSGDIPVDSILELVGTGLKVGSDVYDSYTNQKIAQRNATTERELAEANARIAELNMKAAEILKQGKSEELDKTSQLTKYVTIGGIGLLAIGTLLTLR